MRVLHVAAEAAPLTSFGGLGDAVGGLASAQRRAGIDAWVALPWYRGLTLGAGRPTRRTSGSFAFGARRATFEVWATRSASLRVFLIRSPLIGGLYGARPGAEGYPDYHSLFWGFALAVAAFVEASPWRPDVVHCHDNHAGLVPVFLKGAGLPTVLTIHNGEYQGAFDMGSAPKHLRDQAHLALPSPTSPRAKYVNFLRRGIEAADQVTTVSPTYRDELLNPTRVDQEAREETRRQLGAGRPNLAPALRKLRRPFVGIVNGIDLGRFNPATDRSTAARYTAESLEGKKQCKADLQRRLGLEVSDRPLFLALSRITGQKGFTVLLQTVDALLAQGGQLVICGNGSSQPVNYVKALLSQQPESSAYSPFQPSAEARFYAGADFFLMPSLWEPCGLSQLKAMRYGAIPLVRATGGLVDTVFDMRRPGGFGLVFHRYSATAMTRALRRAFQVYERPRALATLRSRAMKQGRGWAHAADDYSAVYEAVLAEAKV